MAQYYYTADEFDKRYKNSCDDVKNRTLEIGQLRYCYTNAVDSTPRYFIVVNVKSYYDESVHVILFTEHGTVEHRKNWDKLWCKNYTKVMCDVS